VGHAAPDSLGCCLFRLFPRRPGTGPGLFGGGPSAACSAGATGGWLPVLAGSAPGGAGGWCRLTEPPHSCWVQATSGWRGQVCNRLVRCAGPAGRRARRRRPTSPIPATAATAASPPSPHPRRDRSGRIIRDHNYRAHHQIRAHVEHILARQPPHHRRTLEPQNPQPITGHLLAPAGQPDLHVPGLL
jgi:hypothetical protein